MKSTTKKIKEHSGSDRLFQIAVYIVSAFFLLLISFPILYSMSLSFMDLHQMHEVPPRVLPRSPKEVSVIIDYSSFDNLSEEDLLDLTMRENTLVMYNFLANFQHETVGHVNYYGTYKGKIVARGSVHARELQVIWISGLYRQTSLTRKGLLRENLYGDKDYYVEFNEEIGFMFDMDGLDAARDEIGGKYRSLFTEVSDSLYDDMEIEGSIEEVSYTPKFLLALQSYLYYNKQIKETYTDENGSLGSSELLRRTGFLQFFVNTVIVVIFAVLCQITVTPFTAYPLSKIFGKKVSDLMLLFFLGTNFIPFVVIMIPQFKLFQSLGLVDTYGGLLLPHLLPFGFFVFLYKSFFDRIPNSLIDAARIDGANDFYIFGRIIVPLSTPIFFLVFINTFLANITDFFWAWLITSTPSLYTMNVALYNLSRLAITSSQNNMMMGLTILSSLPVVLITLIFTKKIKSVAMTSGIK